MKRLLLGLAALGLACAASAADRAEKEAGPTELVGNYKIVGGEKEGKPEPKERLRGTRVRISRDVIIVTDTKDRKVYAATYTVDTRKKPWTIDMTSVAPKKGEVSLGLVEVHRDTVRIIYGLPKTARPTSFKTNEHQLLFVLKREGAKPKE
jgi:uncharacterized protein (TIGR03067 family)